MRRSSWALGLWTGLVVIGVAAGAVAGFAARQHTFTAHELTAHWAAPYDLVVFPRGVTPSARGLVDPNALNTGTGGISLRQYHRIERIPGVRVSAPLAPVGTIDIALGTVTLARAGPNGTLYRLTETSAHSGLPNGLPTVQYTLLGGRVRLKGFGSVRVTTPPLVSLDVEAELVAISPSAEAKLMGLRHAVTAGHYFLPENNRADRVSLRNTHLGPAYELPLLLTNTSPGSGTVTWTLQELPYPSGLRNQVAAVARSPFFHIGQKGPVALLRGPTLAMFTASERAIYHDLLTAIEGGRPGAIDGRFIHLAPLGSRLTYVNETPVQQGPLRLNPVRSPYPNRWPLAFRADPKARMVQNWGADGEPYRTVTQSRVMNVQLSVVGVYDPSRLRVADDPLTHLPLVNYRPEEGRAVLAADGRALNPDLLVLPDGSPAGLFTAPPEALTPLQAAVPLLGPAPISSIRIRVGGVTGLGAGGERRLEQVARAITSATGLPVAIMRGASPEQILVHPGHLSGYHPAGWIQTEWVRLDASIEILRQLTLSQGVMLGPVLLAAAAFAGISAWLGLFGDRRRWAVALAVGVSPTTIWRELLTRAALHGLTVAGLAIATAGVIGGSRGLSLAVPVGLLAALLVIGAMWPAAREMAQQDPVAGLKPDPPIRLSRMPLVTGAHLGLALAGASWRRLLLALGALVLPAGVAYGVGLVQVAWHNTLHVTFLGQYLLVHGGWLMTAAAMVTAGLTAVAAAEVAAAFAASRRATWAVGTALGWRRRVPGAAMAVEAALVGILAACLGTGIAVAVLSPLFGVPVIPGLALATIVGVGMVSELSALPAVWAVLRQDPVPVLKGVTP